MFWELILCRHPLQELCCSPYVPNNVQSGGGHAKVKILTGPNACGKSVYLKQVFNETFTKNMSTHGAFFTKSISYQKCNATNNSSLEVCLSCHI